MPMVIFSLFINLHLFTQVFFADFQIPQKDNSDTVMLNNFIIMPNLILTVKTL